ncbi:MAG TPA: hypothetical protein DCS35_15530 [Vibrio sp.]|nr:hypothetical protein [Vibrio sp.]
MTEMATSAYLGGLIFLLLTYPFALVAVQMFCYADVTKKKYTNYLNLVVGLAFIILLILHLRTEVIYGEELLNWLEKKPTTQ